MMRKLISIAITFIPLLAISQTDLPVKDGKITYEEVVQIEGTSPELYSKALQWFVKTYNSSNDVIQLKDEANGTIIGKGIFKIDYYTRNPSIRHTITVSVKNGKYRYTITDFSYTDNQSETFLLENFPKGWVGKKKLYNKLNEQTKTLIESLKAFMNKKADNWLTY